MVFLCNFNILSCLPHYVCHAFVILNKYNSFSVFCFFCSIYLIYALTVLVSLNHFIHLLQSFMLPIFLKPYKILPGFYQFVGASQNPKSRKTLCSPLNPSCSSYMVYSDIKISQHDLCHISMWSVLAITPVHLILAKQLFKK